MWYVPGTIPSPFLSTYCKPSTSQLLSRITPAIGSSEGAKNQWLPLGGEGESGDRLKRDMNMFWG